MNLRWQVAVPVLACIFGCSVHAQPQAPVPTSAIDNAAIAKIPAWNGNPAVVTLHLDLTKPFATRSQWTMVVLDDPHQAASGNAPIAVCFVKEISAQCTESRLSDGDPEFYSWRLITDRVVHAGRHKTLPLLWLKTYSSSSVDGNGTIEASLFHYNHHVDSFDRVFSYETFGTNNNQNATFISDGPLTGDVITDYPTEHAPYRYWVEVYAPNKSGGYEQILRYRGYTGYGDGNLLPIADSEMPEILRRLGYWKPGDALPIPRDTSCPHPVLRSREEWCE